MAAYSAWLTESGHSGLSNLADVDIDNLDLLQLFCRRGLSHQGVYTHCDFLPGAHAFLIAFENERTDLFGNMKRSLVAVGLEHRVGAGPELPGAQRHRWPRQ